MEIYSGKIDIQDLYDDLGLNTTSLFEAIKDGFDAALSIEFYEGFWHIFKHGEDEDEKLMEEIGKKILEEFKKIEYPENDPEKAIEMEMDTIEKVVREYERILTDRGFRECRIFFVKDGYTFAYYILFNKFI